MDEQVLRGLAKWPNVPDVYGWLALDGRGRWLLRGEAVTNPVVTAYIGRNYASDEQGRWFFQNGPQRVFVDLEHLPLVYRVQGSGAAAGLETHTGLSATELRGAWIDERGRMVLETERGAGGLDDRDLPLLLARLENEQGVTPSDETLTSALDALIAGRPARLWLAFGSARVPVEPLREAECAERFAFCRRPGADRDLT